MANRTQRRANPHSNREYSQEELDRMAAEMEAYQAELEESYLEARETRIARQAQEQEEWRENRRQQRVQEWVDAHPGCSASEYPWSGFRRIG